MNDEARETLANICKKELHELTPEDIGFLKARRAYLDAHNFSKFSSVIADNQNLVADFVEAASKFAASVLLAIDRRDRAGGLGSSVVVTGYRVVPACLESTTDKGGIREPKPSVVSHR